MRGNIFISCSIILLLSFQILAQNTTEIIKTAKLFYDKNDFYHAIEQYSLVVESNPKNAEAWFKLGNSHHFSRNHQGATKAYKKLTQLMLKNKKLVHKYYKAYFYYGLSLMAIEKYDEAKKVFLNFLRVKTSAHDFRNLKRLATNRIKSCDRAIQLHDESYAKEFTLSTIPEINSEYSDFAPVWRDRTTLIYTTLNKDSLVELANDHPFPVPQSLYTAQWVDNEWQQPELFENFSHDFLHSANGSFSSDKTKFVFSRCQENKLHGVRCALYLSKHENGEWTKPKKLQHKINHANHTSTQPAFGEYKRRGKKYEVLYFVSDRHGGRGQMDIWYSIPKDNGKWTVPVNCGNTINTIGNEITPYYYPGNTNELYFSSDFHHGLGGFDVFKSYGSLKRYKRPENLGVPVNSGFDDTYFSWREYLSNGTLTSNRTGSKSVFLENCCDDIYYFNYESAYIINGHVANSDSVSMENIEVGLVDLEHLEYLDSVNWIGQTNINGDFKLKFQQGKDAYVVVAKEGYETHYIKISEFMLDGEEHHADITMIRDLNWEKQLKDNVEDNVEDNVKVLSQNSLNSNVKTGAVFIMEHIYFDFNDIQIKPEAYQDLLLLEQFLKKNPMAIIEISGHTDNVGTSEQNHLISQRRANTIRDYLINKKIDKKRLISVGYGPDKPIAKNQNSNGTDNPEGRRLNRRIEVRIFN